METVKKRVNKMSEVELDATTLIKLFDERVEKVNKLEINALTAFSFDTINRLGSTDDNTRAAVGALMSLLQEMLYEIQELKAITHSHTNIEDK